MTVRILLPLLAIAAAAAFIPDSRAESPATPGLDRESVRKIVKEYLLEHPEVIEEAIQVLRAKRESREAGPCPRRAPRPRQGVAVPPDVAGLGQPEGRCHPRRVLRLPMRLLQTGR